MNMRTNQVISTAVLTLALGVTANASAQDAPAKLPDAQVEANVLRALAGAPELSTQNIQTSTVYGTVTLTGNVHDEALRTKAENLAARAPGVKKVVDELTLGDTPAPAADTAAPAQPSPSDTSDAPQAGQPVLLSDGTYGPPPDGSGAQPAAAPQDAQAEAPAGDMQTNQQQGPPQGPPPRQPLYQRNYAPNNAPVPGGQQAGMDVTVPAGSMLRIRINRGLDSNHIQPGAPFDGIVLTDVIAGGAVAIPRGATVSGVVVDAKKAGTFKGEGELSLQINNLTLGGNVYPLTTNIWARTGGDKTGSTVANTAGTSAVGALFGAIVGGGKGAAIGAGAGAGLGLAGSAASPRGQVIIPPESVLTFTTAAPTPVKTVSEQEMSRLSYAAGPQGPQGPPPGARVRYYSPQYGYYYGPAYYPR